MIKDTRTPVIVEQVGGITVRIFDETAYRAHIARFYTEEEAVTPRKRSTRSTAKKKTISRFWARKKRVVAIENMVKTPS